MNHPKLPLLPSIVTILVAIAVITGLVLGGSPNKERLRRLDQQRISNLQEIQYSAIEAYAAKFSELPSSLEDAMKQSSLAASAYTDPTTKTSYEYRSIGSDQYELCATFDLPSDAQSDSVSPMWSHTAGHTCFTIKTNLKQPTLQSPTVTPIYVK